ncbi:hypothetical protein EBZ38_05375 [bacterium]|nr:hypothetical protein [bacterium]
MVGKLKTYNMKNTIFWIALGVLALQDLFKKQSAPTKRQQQFLQTGETEQAFIEGNSPYTLAKKRLTDFLGKSTKYKSGYKWEFVYGNVKIEFILTKINLPMSNIGANIIYKISTLDSSPINNNLAIKNLGFYVNELSSREIYRVDRDGIIEENDLFWAFFYDLFLITGNKDYEKLRDMSVNDWELALEIAKGQGLI